MFEDMVIQKSKFQSEKDLHFLNTKKPEKEMLKIN